ncbi:type II toxin-antitoxin system HipA family toxin [Dyella sp. KRB-257]|uniref:type II toxin-antitoxin system HipA family toxin n=1 Tax=Dyella sp. KRB-257 TaxID=3400915 RepID=UPI003C02CDAD
MANEPVAVASARVLTPQGVSGELYHEGRQYAFAYTGTTPDVAVSLTMPVRRSPYTSSSELLPIFQQSLPEGYVLEQLRLRLRLVKLTQLDPMMLLAITGQSGTIGRLAVDAPAVDRLLQRSREPERGERLDEILAWDGAEDLFTELVDRKPLGFEDMATLMGLGTAQKYQGSYERLTRVIGNNCLAEQVRPALAQLFDMVVLCVIVGNGDAHLKNFGLLYTHPASDDARMAPAYDIVNTTAYLPNDTLALTLGGSKSFLAARQHLLEFADRCQVDDPRERIRQLLEAAHQQCLQHADLLVEVPQVRDALQRDIRRMEPGFSQPLRAV